MPELPEVETTRRGIAPHLEGQRIAKLIVRNPALRWPVPDHISTELLGQLIHRVSRRAKYLLLETDTGTLILHLGMSGHLRMLSMVTPAAKHDHFDLVLENGQCLRLNDPRRFGAILWSTTGENHPLLARLGPEPLSDNFTSKHLQQACTGRKAAIKQVIMDNHVVVGVGNIYANEALFLAGIQPGRAAGNISKAGLIKLSEAIRQVLTTAIQQGGTTLRDFLGSDGKPGYFQQQLQVYGRSGEPCLICATPITQIRQGQRSSYYCAQCQK